MFLLQETRWNWFGFGFDYVLIGRATYWRQGRNVDWPQNRENEIPGTQVFDARGRCVTGNYVNGVTISVSVPKPYVVVGSNLIAVDANSGTVPRCEES